MHHFAYRGGVLHAEAVSLGAMADSVGTPFYCYSTATLGAPLPGIRGRLRRCAGARLLRAQGQFQSGRDRDAGAARLGRRCRVRRRIEARAQGRHPAGQDHVLRHRQDRRRARARRRYRHPVRECRIRAGTRPPVRDRRREGAQRRHFRARQSRCRCAHACQDRDRKIREQVRHSDQPRARGLRACRETAGHPRRAASTCISAARSRISRRSRMPSRCLSEFVQTLRADGHTITHVDLGGGLGIPYRDDADVAARSEGLCGDREKCDARSRLQADLRAGTADRRAMPAFSSRASFM